MPQRNLAMAIAMPQPQKQVRADSISTASSASPPRSALHQRIKPEQNPGRPKHRVRFSHSHTPSDTLFSEWAAHAHLPPPWERVDNDKDWSNPADIESFEIAVKTGNVDSITMPQSPSGPGMKKKKYRIWARAPPNDTSEARLANARIGGFTYILIRFPLMLFLFFIMWFELIVYVTVRQIVNLYEYLYTWRGEKEQLRQRLHNAKNYESWKQAAIKLDAFLGREQWKRQAHDSAYDWQVIERLSSKIRYYLETKNVFGMRDVLAQGGVKGNCGGVENRRLYSSTYYGTKDLIENYVLQGS